MENRVYYGEYSLKHWIELILNGNIILPEYQRYFVWSEEKVRTLIDTFRKKRFVPPITIGAFKDGATNQNLIIDGQQRLTSIFLAYVGLYPDEKIYKETLARFASESDEEMEEGDDQLDDVLKWTMKNLTAKGKTKTEIHREITPGNYKELNLGIDDNFLDNTFLGFSYLVPFSAEPKKQQKYYSSVFRHINIQGEALLPRESRKSLYFLDKDLSSFFDPDFIKTFKVKNSSSESELDFVRYLSLLSQYCKEQGANRIARGYKPKMENYYEEYIYSTIGENVSNMFEAFSTIFPDKKFDKCFELLEKSITSLEIPKDFQSIIELDVYFFGLIYETIFKNKALDETKKELLKEELATKISEFKNINSHKTAPNALKYLRERIETSVGIYKCYVK